MTVVREAGEEVAASRPLFDDPLAGEDGDRMVDGASAHGKPPSQLAGRGDALPVSAGLGEFPSQLIRDHAVSRSVALPSQKPAPVSLFESDPMGNTT